MASDIIDEPFNTALGSKDAAYLKWRSFWLVHDLPLHEILLLVFEKSSGICLKPALSGVMRIAVETILTWRNLRI
jgi:hypothetical protein